MASRASAPITVILIVLIAVVLSLAGGGFYLFQKERVKNLELQEQIEEINTKQRITETKLKDSEKLISDLQTKLKDAQGQIDTLNSGLQQEKTASQEALGKIEQLRIDLEQQKKSRSDLENKLDQAQNDLKKTQTQLKNLEFEKSDLETKVKNLEEASQSEGVELGKIKVVPEPAAPVTTAAKIQSRRMQAAPAPAPVPVASEKKAKTLPLQSLEGKVLVINKDYSFVVINLGNKDGINVGNVFSIYHNNKYVGDVKVEKVHDSMAAAGVVSGDINKVSEGDKIVQKVK